MAIRGEYVMFGGIDYYTTQKMRDDTWVLKQE
jgi:hypothetical protein